MEPVADPELPAWGPLILAYASPGLRRPMRALLLLDAKLSWIYANIGEPALAQIRMAWWREELMRQRDANALPPPDPLLADLLESWHGHGDALTGLIDGWEGMLAEQPWSQSTRDGFAFGRGQAFRALALMSNEWDAAAGAERHGRIWGLATLLELSGVRGSDKVEDLPGLPRTLRPLAIVGGLSRRAISRDSGAIFGDRLSPLAALRLGIFGT